MTQLVRSMKTEVVHDPQCKVQGGSCLPWYWATTRSLAEVTEETAVSPWLHLCRACLPGACLCGKCRKS